MAPRTRSCKTFTREEIRAHQEALRAGPVNITGLPALPVELLLEIASHFHTVPIPTVRWSPYDATYTERITVIRALSQMCRSLRSTFLPHLWQRIEVCASKLITGGREGSSSRVKWGKDLATELVSQLEIVTIRDPTLARYVKIINVMVTSFSAPTVMVEFARCLSLFPNLHTIQILGRHGYVDNQGSRRSRYTHTTLEQAITKAFKDKQFKSVRTVVVPKHAHSILAACPEARNVTAAFHKSERMHPFLMEIAIQKCPYIEVLRGYNDINYTTFMEEGLLQKFISGFPNTHTMTISAENTTLSDPIVKQFSQFPLLRCIEITVAKKKSDSKSLRLKTLIRTAEKVLRDIPDLNGKQKCLMLKFNDGSERIVIV